jgi:hypothetical protein
MEKIRISECSTIEGNWIKFNSPLKAICILNLIQNGKLKLEEQMIEEYITSACSNNVLLNTSYTIYNLTPIETYCAEDDIDWIAPC